MKIFKRKVLDYKHADWEALKSDIKEKDWSDVLGKETANDMAEEWTRTYMRLVERHIPT